MQTIFITSFHPHISRNVLATSAFSLLKARSDIKIVLVVPAYKAEYFRERFGGANVLVEGVALYRASRTLRGLFFKKLAIFLFDSESARNRKRYDYYLTGKVFRYSAAMILGALGHSALTRRAARALDLRLSPKGLFDELLARLRPDAVFSTDVQNENDVSLMQDARRRGIRVIAMARSWDNLTLRFLRVFPDRLIVGSEVLARELKEFHGYPSSRLAVTGNPHYDRYRQGPDMDRAAFPASFGLDPAKKLILYAPVSDALIRINDMDQYIMGILAGLSVNIMVRFPPEKGVRLENFAKPSHMAYDRPGQAFKENEVGDREIRPEDDAMLMRELSYADVVVTGPTSIALDAMFFDKPAIMADIYPTPRHFFEGVWRYRDNHIKKLAACGGVTYADTKEKLLDAIAAYLKNPASGSRGRAAARALWFSHADGRAGERLAHELISFLGLENASQ